MSEKQRGPRPIDFKYRPSDRTTIGSVVLLALLLVAAYDQYQPIDKTRFQRASNEAITTVALPAN